MADNISGFLKDIPQTAISVGDFTSPPQMAARGGPAIALALADGLKQRGINVKRRADWGIKGEYRLVEDQDKGVPTAQVRAQVLDSSGEVRRNFFHDLCAGEIPQPKREATLVGLFGASVELPTDKGPTARNRLLKASFDKPAISIRDSRIAVNPDSPYAIEIWVSQETKMAPRTAAEQEGLAFVPIRRGEVFAVNLINDSDRDAAVTLTIDGVNMFAFSDHPSYRYVVVPKKSHGLVKGWHRTNQNSDSFEVTSFSKSAAAEVLPQSQDVGMITAQFAAAWPRSVATPLDEKRILADNRAERDATGRGPEVQQTYREVERVVGDLRTAISVRYTQSQ